MDAFRINRTINPILAVLLVISISALGTVLYKNNREAKKNQEISVRERCSASGTFLKKELGLTDAQESFIENISGTCRGSSQCLKMKLYNRKAELLVELSKENSDTVILNRIATNYGATQTVVIKMTIQQYLEIKRICTPEQRIKLSVLYSELFGCCKQDMPGGKQGCRGAENKDCYTDSVKKR